MADKLPFELEDKELVQVDCLIHGVAVAAKSGRRFDMVDPGSGKTWASCAESSKADVEAAVESSQRAFEQYSRWTPRQRAECLAAWHRLVKAAKEDLAKLLVHETGKPLGEARNEVDYGLTYAWWFAGEAERIHGSTMHSAAAGRRALVIKQPVGVTAGLVPWNFPVVLVLRKAGAALAAGCTMVIKPSPETSLTGLALGRLALRAGFPPGALNVLPTSLDETPGVAEALCEHPLVRLVSLTGSTRVGKIVSQLCARNLKKVTLELGGNCPFIIFDDANMDQVLDQLMALKWRHASQVCITANRVYVQRGVHDAFVEALVQRTGRLKLGHGMASGTTLGPLTTTRGLDKAEMLAQDALQKGAVMACGTGRRQKGDDGSDGFFFKPTIMTGVQDDMLMSRQEIFAPLLGVSVFDAEDDVVARANKTSMGLASYVFTKNVDRLWRMFEKLEAGMVGLNTGASSSAEAPFGGIKESGLGKESGKDVAVEEFLIAKTGTLTIEGHW
ncbi:hypothetical protein CDD82_7815 [Ophiocordyceps australis]|uniref:Aldehyde dehydrogenase domain-containing protein n=1 Tax=Ophiocordyceps australis TaxID=1399860 RepID=A0A2C5YP09_9HYPO|nr:hypothetical protein CDD82_7815 [Ophiocordyceps australis]